MFFNQNQPDNKPKYVRNLTNQLTQGGSERADIRTDRPEESISFNPNFHSTPYKPTFNFSNNSLTSPPEPSNPRDIPKFNFLFGSSYQPVPSAPSKVSVFAAAFSDNPHQQRVSRPPSYTDLVSQNPAFHKRPTLILPQSHPSNYQANFALQNQQIVLAKTTKPKTNIFGNLKKSFNNKLSEFTDHRIKSNSSSSSDKSEKFDTSNTLSPQPTDKQNETKRLAEPKLSLIKPSKFGQQSTSDQTTSQTFHQQAPTFISDKNPFKQQHQYHDHHLPQDTPSENASTSTDNNKDYP
jgi:hypothetical protein